MARPQSAEAKQFQDDPVMIERAIDMIADGAYLRDIQAETGLDKRRISEILRRHPDYPSAKLVAIDNQLDDAQKALKDATEMTDIAQARERFKAAAWRAEHEMPQLFSTQRMLVTTNLPVQLDAMPQLELARRVAWILTSGAAAARAQAQAQLALPAPGPEPAT